IVAVMIDALRDLLLRGHRLELDHRHVAAGLEGAVLVEHIGYAARHAGGKISSGLSEHDHHAAGHVFAAVVAGALDDRDGAWIADPEAFAGDAAEVAFTLDRAIEHGVADDDRLFRHEAAVGGGTDDDAAAGETLADIVVGVALELESHAVRQPGAEALASGAGQLHVDGVVRQALVAIALGDFA